MTELDKSKEPIEVDDGAVDERRREALGWLGRYSAYTAPALLGLLIGTKSARAVSISK